MGLCQRCDEQIEQAITQKKINFEQWTGSVFFIVIAGDSYKVDIKIEKEKE